MCFWSTTASDPDLASTYRQYLCAAGILCSRSPGIYRLRRQSANTRRCHCQIVAALRQIWSVRRCLPQHALMTLICALVVSKVDYWTGCSPSSTLPADSCSQPGAPNASPRFSATFIGCGSRNGFNSVSAFWHSDVSMNQRRHISLRAFVGQPMWKVVATSALLPP